MSKMNPVVRGILNGVAIFAIVIVIQYLKSVIWKEAFTPDWVASSTEQVIVWPEWHGKSHAQDYIM